REAEAPGGTRRGEARHRELPAPRVGRTQARRSAGWGWADASRSPCARSTKASVRHARPRRPTLALASPCSFGIPTEIDAPFGFKSQRDLDDLATRLLELRLLDLPQEFQIVLEQFRRSLREPCEDCVQEVLRCPFERDGEPLARYLAQELSHRLRIEPFQILEGEHRLPHIGGELRI